jgi:hypothetical protein
VTHLGYSTDTWAIPLIFLLPPSISWINISAIISFYYSLPRILLLMFLAGQLFRWLLLLKQTYVGGGASISAAQPVCNHLRCLGVPCANNIKQS